MNISRHAFLLSVLRLEGETGQLYLWTLTYRRVMTDDAAMAAWAKMCMSSGRFFRGLHGLRVIELHENHGIHFHLLLNRRFPVRRMLSLAWPFGFGIIDVRRADRGAADYLAKYLTKKCRDDSYFPHRRRWAAFGGFEPCRCKDVEVDNPYQRNKHLLPHRTSQTRENRMRRLLFAAMCQFGDFEYWPDAMRISWLQQLGYSPEMRVIPRPVHKITVDKTGVMSTM